MNSRRAKVSLVVLLAVALGLCGLRRYVNAKTHWDAPQLDMSRVSDEEPEPSVRQLGEHLFSVDGLKVVVVSGSPRQMGERYGRAVAEEIKRGRDSYLNKHVCEDQGYTKDYLLKCSEVMLKHIPPEYVQEMHGVAQGAGVPYEDVLAMHTHADIVHYGHDWGDNQTNGLAGCSNFVAWGGATLGGKLYHGRNLDWTIGTDVQEVAVVYIGIPREGYPFALVTYAGMIGAVTGMNSQGITFGEMTSQTGDQTLDGEPLFIVCRRMLQYCGTIAQVEELMKRHTPTTGWNYVVASGRECTGRAFEVDAGNVVVFKPNDPSERRPPVSQGCDDAVYRTNHPTSLLLQKKAARSYGIKSLTLAKLAITQMDTWRRYEALRQWISEMYRGRIDERVARAMLQSAPLNAGNNLHSVLFVPEEGKMWVANASPGPDARPAYGEKYHLVRPGELLAAAEAGGAYAPAE